MSADAVVTKHRALSEQLYEKTEGGRLKWSESVLVSGYEVQLGDHIITISSSPGEFESEDYTIQVLSRGYDVIDSFMDNDVLAEGVKPKVGSFSGYYPMFRAMYRMIQRQVSGADIALDDVLKSLSDL